MKNWKKILCLTLVLAMCTTVGAVAASKLVVISAYLNHGITITYDGEVQTMYDANGNRVIPITFNGTTYLPVRAVSNMMDVNVEWDAANNTVVLGDAPVKPYELKRGTLYDGTEAKSFTVAGQNQTVGFKLLGRSISSDSYALFAVNGKDTLSFDVGHVDGTGTALLDLAVFLDDQYVKTYDITATQGIKHIDIDLDGASVVKLQFVGEAGYFSGEYGFFNLELK